MAMIGVNLFSTLTSGVLAASMKTNTRHELMDASAFII